MVWMSVSLVNSGLYQPLRRNELTMRPNGNSVVLLLKILTATWSPPCNSFQKTRKVCCSNHQRAFPIFAHDYVNPTKSTFYNRFVPPSRSSQPDYYVQLVYGRLSLRQVNLTKGKERYYDGFIGRRFTVKKSSDCYPLCGFNATHFVLENIKQMNKKTIRTSCFDILLVI